MTMYRVCVVRAYDCMCIVCLCVCACVYDHVSCVLCPRAHVHVYTCVFVHTVHVCVSVHVVYVCGKL